MECSGIRALSGGDISQCFQVCTHDGYFVVKTNTHQLAVAMFEAERKALMHLGKMSPIVTPQVYTTGQTRDHAYLLMEFIEAKKGNEEDYRRLGGVLAQMHSGESEFFGWEEDNFIATLVQNNTGNSNWGEFFYRQRLLPQFELAASHKRWPKEAIPAGGQVIQRIEELSGKVKPALLHGDLWAGNHLIREDGVAVLIDPASYYGHSEVDMAMSRLFGGYPDSFYQAYYERAGGQPNYDLQEIYQLYFLLVHLNLFGASYYQSVKRIVDRYFP